MNSHDKMLISEKNMLTSKNEKNEFFQFNSVLTAIFKKLKEWTDNVNDKRKIIILRKKFILLILKITKIF